MLDTTTGEREHHSEARRRQRARFYPVARPVWVSKPQDRCSGSEPYGRWGIECRSVIQHEFAAEPRKQKHDRRTRLDSGCCGNRFPAIWLLKTTRSAVFVAAPSSVGADATREYNALRCWPWRMVYDEALPCGATTDKHDRIVAVDATYRISSAKRAAGDVREVRGGIEKLNQRVEECRRTSRARKLVTHLAWDRSRVGDRGVSSAIQRDSQTARPWLNSIPDAGILQWSDSGSVLIKR